MLRRGLLNLTGGSSLDLCVDVGVHTNVYCLQICGLNGAG